MKKILVITALIAAMLCSLFVFSASATEVENIHISSTDFQVRQGEEFTTTIYIADNANIIDFEALLKYDPEKLTLISAVESEDITIMVDKLEDWAEEKSKIIYSLLVQRNGSVTLIRR